MQLTFIEIGTIFISLLAFITSYIAIRLQIQSLILSQLLEKAKESNSYAGNLSNANNISGVFTAIITAKQLLDLQCSKYFISNKQSLIDQFYLQLDTTIRINLSRDTMSIQFEILHPHIQEQITDSITFFIRSKKKYR